MSAIPAGGSNGARFSYGFGPKRHFRRWAWNRLRDRGDKRGVVLYLPSREDVDAQVAIKKGFRPQNLIAVEREKVIVEALRKQGRLVVHGDFMGALLALSRCKKISAVYGDFCSGIGKTDVGIAAVVMQLLTCRTAAFCFNFMRGRDPQSNEIRGLASGDLRVEIKNRGVLFAVAISGVLGEMWLGKTAHRDILKMMDVDFHSYKSTSGHYFDSVSFVSPVRYATDEEAVVVHDRVKATFHHLLKRVSAQTVASAAAAAAWHTRKQLH